MTSHQQIPLVVETLQEAKRAAVAALGGAKVVGPMLWPEKGPEESARLLLDCLNPDRPHRLDPERFVLLMRKAREAGYHGLMEFTAESAGYTRPAPVEPEDEMAALQRDFLSGLGELKSIAARFERAASGARAKR